MRLLHRLRDAWIARRAHARRRAALRAAWDAACAAWPADLEEVRVRLDATSPDLDTAHRRLALRQALGGPLAALAEALDAITPDDALLLAAGQRVFLYAGTTRLRLPPRRGLRSGPDALAGAHAALGWIAPGDRLQILRFLVVSGPGGTPPWGAHWALRGRTRIAR